MSNLVENCLIVPKIEHDLDIMMINLYIQFHYNTYNLCEEKLSTVVSLEGERLNSRNISLGFPAFCLPVQKHITNMWMHSHQNLVYIH